MSRLPLDGPAAKRAKASEPVASSFLADLQDMVADMDADAVASSATWKRPPLPHLNPAVERVVFQQLELDHYLSEEPLPGMPGAGRVKPVPVVRMYGVNESGNSILCHVHGFFPYFYAPAPIGFTDSHCQMFLTALNVAALSKANAKGVTDIVLAVELQLKESIFGFHGNRKIPFVRITVSQHRLISACKRVLEDGFQFSSSAPVIAYECYETNIEYNLRFMVDTGVVGCQWIELPAGTYRVREAARQQSLCQLEVDVAFNAFVAHPPEGEWAKVAPFRILSFDIECAGRKGIFPEAEIDPVIQIANMVMVQGESKPCIRNVFTLNTCANIVGAQVLEHSNEKDLLENWAQFFRESDCDMVTGYNIMNFDLPYLLNRAKHLKCMRFPYFGRIRNEISKLSETKFTSKAFGSRESQDVNIDGRVKFDLLQILQRDFKLRSYTLNSVSAHFLNEQKEDVHHSIITDLQNGTDQTRHRLAVYCMKDAYLPLRFVVPVLRIVVSNSAAHSFRLLNKLMLIFNYMEMARVTGVPFSFLLTRGQQIKVLSQLLRVAREEHLVIPVYNAQGGSEETQFEGATVIMPKKGYYDVPIATLDFASLYPSIMMAHNLCYTSLLTDNERAKLSPDQYIKTPEGHYFVKDTTRPGVLPRILNDLLTARKRAKNDLKKEQDPFKRAVLDGRQLALKISANSVYGFTGATIGRLPCLAISSSVTAFGRDMIESTAKLVMEKYCIANGYEHNADVIYGDTDSVMIKFGLSDVSKAMAIAAEAADFVSATFKKPIKLEFEKVYFPYILIQKKRYAGLYWTKPDKWDKMDTKGIVTVRRDNCPLVVTLINTCLQKLLIERNAEGAVEYAKEVISDVLCNRVDISQLVITKALSRSKEDYAGRQAHVELAERMRKRDAGSAPAMGDRVAYVIIQARKGAPAFEKSEDPIFVLENNIPIDTKYYIEHQLTNPLMSIFEPVMGEAKAKSLLSGEHTRTVVQQTRSDGGLMKFTKKQATCLGCKVPIPLDTGALCGNCALGESQLFQREMSKLTVLETRFSRLWSQCQRCQGSLHQDVLCTSKDCPIFYMRKKVQHDLKDQDAIVARFGGGWDF